MSKPLLMWEKIGESRDLRGYLVGHPETTLFFLQHYADQRYMLQGAFVPDGEEHEPWDIKNAKAAAERYLMDWLVIVDALIKGVSK